MALFNTSGTRGRQAAAGQMAAITAAQQGSQDALRQGYGMSMPYYEIGRGDLREGRDAALTALAGRYGDANRYMDRAYDEYTPVLENARGGATLYSDAAGAGGAEGAARAMEAFRGANPAWDFIRGESERAGAQSLNRSAGGQVGNVAVALQDRAKSLADTTYGAWSDRLLPLLQQYGQVAAARAGVLGSQANLNAQLGNQEASVNQTAGQGLGTLSAAQGAQAMNLGKYSSDALLSLLPQQTAAIQGGYGAGEIADKNRTAAIMGGVDLGMKLLGTGLGGNLGGALAGGTSGSFNKDVAGSSGWFKDLSKA